MADICTPHFLSCAGLYFIIFSNSVAFFLHKNVEYLCVLPRFQDKWSAAMITHVFNSYSLVYCPSEEGEEEEENTTPGSGAPFCFSVNSTHLCPCPSALCPQHAQTTNQSRLLSSLDQTLADRAGEGGPPEMLGVGGGEASGRAIVLQRGSRC